VHDAVAKRKIKLVDAPVWEYGASARRAQAFEQPRCEHFPALKEVSRTSIWQELSGLPESHGTGGRVGIYAWEFETRFPIAIKVARQSLRDATVVINDKRDERDATEVLWTLFMSRFASLPLSIRDRPREVVGTELTG